MQITLHHFQLADSIHTERSGRSHGRSTRDPGPTLRTRIGQRLIGLGERLAGTRTATAIR